MEQVKKKTEAYLANLSPEELNKQIVVPWEDKPYTKVSVETILSHMVMEDMIHYGELSAACGKWGRNRPTWAFGATNTCIRKLVRFKTYFTYYIPVNF